MYVIAALIWLDTLPLICLDLPMIKKKKYNSDGWDHRVIKSEGCFQIHEVYYVDDKPTSCTIDAVSPCGETLGDLKAELKRMLLACDVPTLSLKDFQPLKKGKLK